MSFKFLASDRSVADGVRRMAREQFEKALHEASDQGRDLESTVHGVRRRCKKLRGLLRLIKPVFKEFSEENAAIRDAAAGLSHSRDAAVMIETLDALVREDESHGDHAEIDAAAYGQLRETLIARQKETAESDEADAMLAEFRAAMLAGLERSKGWRLKRGGFGAIGEGLVDTYRAMRREMRAASANPTDEQFHEWRKHVKYHWHHINLLRATAPELLASRRKLANELGDVLGDHHNLAVLTDLLEREGEALVPAGVAQQALLAAGQRQARLEERAFALGEQLAAEKPKAMCKRFERYWMLFRE